MLPRPPHPRRHLDELRRADPLSRTPARLRPAPEPRHTQVAANDSGGARDQSLATTLGLSLAEFRSRVAHVQAAVTIEGTGCEERMADEALTPHDEAAEKQERGRLADATGRLQPRERELLRLHYEEGENFREISDRFSVSESRVSQIHTRAIMNLRLILSD
ncbi:MAG: sigma-70 family RNA polymerase sigma factor [Deltaproteobacteria bacterium]|nr:sigma-70 family RNA polymerase sigma factor [Deltaproteobacteria bacterium]